MTVNLIGEGVGLPMVGYITRRGIGSSRANCGREVPLCCVFNLLGRILGSYDESMGHVIPRETHSLLLTCGGTKATNSQMKHENFDIHMSRHAVVVPFLDSRRASAYDLDLDLAVWRRTSRSI